MQLLRSNAKSQAKVSIILLDWGVRESFHSLYYLNQQTVPRENYELIWVEFYDRKPAGLLELMEGKTVSILDKWLVMGYPDNVTYHKHRMYNAGIILSQGDICVFCDSDAIFEPTFVESIIKAFAEQSNVVIHLDEVRNYSKRFYPFNYPPIREVLREGCVNWTGKLTTGLDNSPDMLHTANYGACMAARRTDLIQIGGADEHIDYLGYICGPYELTFRLVNHGLEERWLRNEFLYHVWHPNTSGCNIEYKGRDDGKGMSLLALELRDNGRIEPYLENLAIQQLRNGKVVSTEILLDLLVNEDDDAWNVETTFNSSVPTSVEYDFRGFDIILFRNTWFGVPKGEGKRFDPAKVKNQEYSQCLTATTRDELLALVARHWRFPIRHTPFGRMLRKALGRLPVPAALKAYGKRLVKMALGDGKPVPEGAKK